MSPNAIQTAALIAHGIVGAVAFFVLFAAMFNGLNTLMLAAGAIGLGVNLVVSMRVARRGAAAGVRAAAAFGAGLLGVLLAAPTSQPRGSDS